MLNAKFIKNNKILISSPILRIVFKSNYDFYEKERAKRNSYYQK